MCNKNFKQKKDGRRATAPATTSALPLRFDKYQHKTHTKGR